MWIQINKPLKRESHQTARSESLSGILYNSECNKKYSSQCACDLSLCVCFVLPGHRRWLEQSCFSASGCVIVKLSGNWSSVKSKCSSLLLSMSKTASIFKSFSLSVTLVYDHPSSCSQTSWTSSSSPVLSSTDGPHEWRLPGDWGPQAFYNLNV